MSDSPATTRSPTPADYRYAFNLPRGSVRGALVLMIMLPFWVLIAAPDRLIAMPFYVYFLMIWVFFFIASPFWSISTQQGSTDQPAPFHLPKYTIHVIIALVTVGVVGWRAYKDPMDLLDRLTPGGWVLSTDDPTIEKAKQLAQSEAMRQLPGLLLSLAIGFIGGWGLARILGKWRDVYWFQDIQASVSLIAMLAILVLTLIHIINATLLQEVPTKILEYIAVGLVAWYFGART